MSVVEVGDHHDVRRRFAEGDTLPTPWGVFKTLKNSDTLVVHSDGQELTPHSHPAHETIEGLGWVMLAKTADVITDKKAA